MARSPLPLTELKPGAWTLDCLGMLCPIPISKTGLAVRRIPTGALLTVVADDPGVELDLTDWCTANRQELIDIVVAEGIYTTTIRKLR
jgi:TusA-related sulfurtransferase